MNRSNDPRFPSRAPSAHPARGGPPPGRFPPRGGPLFPHPPQRRSIPPGPSNVLGRGPLPTLPPAPAGGRIPLRGTPPRPMMAMPSDGRQYGHLPIMRGGRNVRPPQGPTAIISSVPMGRGQWPPGHPGIPPPPLPPPPPPPRGGQAQQRTFHPPPPLTGRPPGSLPGLRPPFGTRGGPMAPHVGIPPLAMPHVAPGLPPPHPPMRAATTTAMLHHAVGRSLPPPPPPPPPPPHPLNRSHSLGQPPVGQPPMQIQPTMPIVGPAAVGVPQSHTRNTAQFPSTASQLASYPSVPAPTNAVSMAGTASGSSTVAASNKPAIPEPQSDVAWTEHSAPNGMKYYYNSITKESTYLKPDALKLRTWNEYTDPSTGRTYYSDGVRTTWEKPAELKGEATVESVSSDLPSVSTTAKSNEVPALDASTPSQSNGSLDGPKKKKRKFETEFSNKEEAIAAFKGLLLAKDIAPTLKWNEVTKICAGDPRWEACEDVLTVGERKQALAEYQTKRANELRENERQERARAKQAFSQMLAAILPTVSDFSCWNSRFADVRATLAKDDRFHAVVDDATRESLFLDFCEENRKRDERKKRNKRRDAQDAFLAFLKEKEDNGEVSYASTWESFVASLGDTDKVDSRFTLLPERSNDDRQVYFADFVLELQAKEDDKRRRIRDARERAQLEQKYAFRDSLEQLSAEGKLIPASRWRAIEELLSAQPSFAPLKAQNPDAPREIFEDFANEWNNTYRRDRTFLSQLVYPSAKSDVLVKSDTTYEDFCKQLLDRASESTSKYDNTKDIISRDNPVSSARLYFNELSMRARGIQGPAFLRRGSSSRRGKDSDSSEDEGEIIEDGEVVLDL